MPRRNKRAATPSVRRTVRSRKLVKEVVDVDGNVVRVKLRPIVKPDGFCTLPSGRRKFAFNTEEKANRALTNARHNRTALGKAHVEDHVYSDCKGVPDPEVDLIHYHLTSIATEEATDDQEEA